MLLKVSLTFRYVCEYCFSSSGLYDITRGPIWGGITLIPHCIREKACFGITKTVHHSCVIIYIKHPPKLAEMSKYFHTFFHSNLLLIIVLNKEIYFFTTEANFLYNLKNEMYKGSDSVHWNLSGLLLAKVQYQLLTIIRAIHVTWCCWLSIDSL